MQTKFTYAGADTYNAIEGYYPAASVWSVKFTGASGYLALEDESTDPATVKRCMDGAAVTGKTVSGVAPGGYQFHIEAAGSCMESLNIASNTAWPGWTVQ